MFDYALSHAFVQNGTSKALAASGTGTVEDACRICVQENLGRMDTICLGAVLNK